MNVSMLLYMTRKRITRIAYTLIIIIVQSYYTGFSVTADLGAQVTKISARLVCGKKRVGW